MERISVDSLDAKEIRKVSDTIYEYAELGSEEFRSSRFLVESLQAHGFAVEYPYMGMETAFRAEFGNGEPILGVLAEYDALPNGHSCGHNIISAWAFGTAVTLSRIIPHGKIVVYGTPSEEGIGKLAGSKVLMADNGAFDGIEAVFGCHPDAKWAVGSTALSDMTMQFIFEGKASHVADAPEEGVNALDAAVLAYQGINNLRSWIKIDHHPVISMLFREAGSATNVVPDRAVLEVELRSTSGDFLKTMKEKVRKVVKGCAESFGATLTEKTVTPLYQNYKNNRALNHLLMESLKDLGVEPHFVETTEIPSGSTDEANVSQVAPTGHLDIRISEIPIPGHSDKFREAADPEHALASLLTGVAATVNACLKLAADREILEKAKREFAEGEE